MEAVLASAADWDEVLPLVGAPQGDAWGLAQRHPHGLHAAFDSGRNHLVVVRHQGRIAACGIRTVRAVLYESRPALLGYLTCLRRDPALPLQLAHAGLQAAFACLAATRRADELPADLTSILVGNRRAQRLLEAGLPGVPRYHRRAVYFTRIWSQRALARCTGPCDTSAHGLDVRLVLQPVPQAQPSIAPAQGGRETVATAMPAALRWLRPAVDAFRRWRGLPALPRPGHALPLRFLSGWSWRPGEAMNAFAQAGALARVAPSGTLIVGGWSADHPDALAIAQAAPRAEIIAAQWYTVGGELPPGPLHLEAGWL